MLKQTTVEKVVKPFIVDNTGEEVPWHPLGKPLPECRLGLVTTAGVHLKSQDPFDIKAKQGDANYRELPADTSTDAYRISHTHYDHSEADKDINCVYPIDRVKELAEEGYIKGVTEINFGFMGFMLKPMHDKLKAHAREIADKFLEQNTDAVLLTPGWPFCHQSVGLIARELEAKGLSTVTISLMQGITSKIKPPRAVLLRFPLGRVTGAAFDLKTQKEVVTAAVQTLEEITTPGETKKLPFKWKEK